MRGLGALSAVLLRLVRRASRPSPASAAQEQFTLMKD
jgi:hypothetical protein